MIKNIFKCFIFSLLVIFINSYVFADEAKFEPNEIILNQTSYKLNAINPTPLNNIRGSSYPGLRGSNQMIVYTADFGLRTGTNEFGAEAVVENNTVVALSGADSIIPVNGFVISGHGNAKKWINKNITIGSKVFVDYDSKKINVYLTSESYLYEAKEKIKEAEMIVEYYKVRNKNYNWKTPCMCISKAKSYVKKARRSPKNIKQYSAYAIEAANLALQYSIPYDKNELKGVWLRPTEACEADVIKTIEKIHSAGINEIFLETYFHGQTIFPSNVMESYGFVKQNPKFSDYDPLRVYIREAHKRHMKVNIWFETFYIGNSNPANNPQNIISVKPEWANINKININSEVPVYSKSEHNGYFLDPANPDVQMYLESLLTEIIEVYHPDGINLDYVRYPQSLISKYSNYADSNWGYTKYAREDFLAKYGKDPAEINYGDDLWLMWDKYRQDKISSFILRINELTRKNNVNLTTVIFPDIKQALETKQQDWTTWSLSNSLNGVTPLFLTSDAQTTRAMLNEIIKNTSPSTKIYAGLFTTFMNGSKEDLLRQIHIARQSRVNGVILFDYAHLNDYINTLNSCVFNPVPIDKASSKRMFKKK